jgi:hypothetical protein
LISVEEEKGREIGRAGVSFSLQYWLVLSDPPPLQVVHCIQYRNIQQTKRLSDQVEIFLPVKTSWWSLWSCSCSWSGSGGGYPNKKRSSRYMYVEIQTVKVSVCLSKGKLSNFYFLFTNTTPSILCDLSCLYPRIPIDPVHNSLTSPPLPTYIHYLLAEKFSVTNALQVGRSANSESASVASLVQFWNEAEGS